MLEENVISPSDSRDKIIISSLHTKLGFLKQYKNVLDTNGECFSYLILKFPSLSYKKYQFAKLELESESDSNTTATLFLESLFT